ncbi:uncharacterized protein AC631_01124 [Debaryomyces fabryi]|uniref:Mif2/CENP-C cupin domain-containing protein n=1 Tax=Debaryomyces fabryi TaxID=58627 RepID=A0A0V1Q3R7_9ASCO|nr:uncharacterized protein AC631_01124 [Debaryomyces fabryi]KSA03111.1 hypothetical protein AC631_01124 [Debaryomyces fabryi]CUM45989.1 unnamed protein product [Debaryomyces fabryi]
MDLLNLGSQSRKTGLKPRANLRKDKYNMEDVDEFFAEEEEDKDNDYTERRPQKSDRSIYASGLAASRGSEVSAESSTPRHNFNNVARKINFTDVEAEPFNLSPISIQSKHSKNRNKKSPLRSPLQENKARRLTEGGTGDDEGYDYNDNIDMDNDLYGDDIDMSLSPVDLSPIKLRTEYISKDSKKSPDGTPKSKSKPKSKSSVNKSASSLTKKMALGTTKPRRKRHIVEEESEEDTTQEYSPDEKSELLSPPPTTKKEPVRNQISQEKITKPSPLPSPPPDGLRRSKRTKIAPLAFWRNERIVYTRAADEEDADTTLASDIKNIPLQEIEAVVHIPEANKYISTTANKKRSGLKLRITPPKLKKSLPKQVAYDYESDPEINGSEWFKDKSLKLRVFEGPSDDRVERSIAWAPNEGDFENPPNTGEIENFKVAALFGDDRDFTAGGLIEFPYGGFKSLRNSSDSVYIFHVVKGLIEVTLNENKFVVTRGCSFHVPRANTFAFKNLGQDTSKLFFVQSKKVIADDDEEWE